MSTGARLTQLALTVEGALVLVALALGWLLGVPPFGRFAWGWAATGLAVLLTLPAVLALWWAATTRWAPLVRLRQAVEHSMLPLFRQCTVPQLLLVSLAAGIGEEALFRGVLQEAATQAWGPLAGITAVSVLFGLAHLITPTYAIGAAILGGYFGVVYWWTGNLLVPIAVHALYDAVGLLVFTREDPAAAHPVPPAPGASDRSPSTASE